jgi:hypothetical protein
MWPVFYFGQKKKPDVSYFISDLTGLFPDRETPVHSPARRDNAASMLPLTAVHQTRALPVRADTPGGGQTSLLQTCWITLIIADSCKYALTLFHTLVTWWIRNEKPIAGNNRLSF